MLRAFFFTSEINSQQHPVLCFGSVPLRADFDFFTQAHINVGVMDQMANLRQDFKEMAESKTHISEVCLLLVLPSNDAARAFGIYH